MSCIHQTDENQVGGNATYSFKLNRRIGFEPQALEELGNNAVCKDRCERDGVAVAQELPVEAPIMV